MRRIWGQRFPALSRAENPPSSLQEAFSPKEARSRAELQAILKNPHRHSQDYELLALGRRLQAQNKPELALKVYRWLAQQGEVAEDVQAAAGKEAEALQGKGGFGSRVEVLLGQVASEATNPRLILPMMGATVVGSLGKAFTMTRALQAPAGMLTRGLGSKLFSGALGFGAEGFVFATLGASLSPETSTSFSSDLARAYLGLGALKFSGWAGQGAIQSKVGTTLFSRRISQTALPQAAMLVGLSLAHALETKTGLRPDSGDFLADTLASLISLQVGARLGHAVLGKGFQTLRQSLELAGRQGSGPSLWEHSFLKGGHQGPRSWALVSAAPGGRTGWKPLATLGEGKVPGGRIQLSFSRGSVKSGEALEIKGDFVFQDKKKWSVAEIGEVVRAIVAQDSELYPKGDATPMSESRKFLERLYRVGGEELRLLNLIGRVRQAKGVNATDREGLPPLKVLQEWKRDLFGVEPDVREVAVLPPSSPPRSPEQEKALQEALQIETRLGGVDPMVRSSAIDTLEKIIPSLSPADRFPRVLIIEAKLRDLSLEVRLSAIRALEKIIPSLSPADRFPRVLQIEARLEDKSLWVRRSAIDALREIIPHLSPADRLPRALKIEARLGDKNGEVRSSAIRALEKIIPSLSPADRLPRVLQIEARLEDENPRIRDSAIDALREIIPHLSPADRLPLVLQVEARFGDRKTGIRYSAVQALREIIPSLSPADRLPRALKIEARLGDKDVDVRGFAILALREIIPHLSPADRLPLALQIKARLGDEDPKVRRSAIEALEKILPHLPPKDHLPLTLQEDRLRLALQIEEKLVHANSRVRDGAIKSLEKTIPSLSPEDLLHLALEIEARLGDEDSRNKAVNALKAIIPSLSPKDRLRLALKIEKRLGKKGELHDSAVDALGEIVPHLSPEDRLRLALKIQKRLGDEDSRVHGSAISALSVITPSLSPEDRLPLVLQIEARLEDKSWQVRRSAIYALEKIISRLPPEDRHSLVLQIEARLGDQDSEVRRSAIRALRAIIPRLPPEDRHSLVLQIEARLGDQDSEVRLSAIRALRAIIPSLPPEDRLPRALLIEARLEDEHPIVRDYAVGALGRVIPHLSPEDRLRLALQIEARLRDQDPEVHSSAVGALGRVIPHLSPEDRLPRALKIETRLGDQDPEVRGSASRALGKIVPHLSPEDRLPRVLQIEARLGDQDPEVRGSASRALGKIVPHLSPEDRLPRVLQIEARLGDQDPEVRGSAIDALREIIPQLRPRDRLTLLSTTLSSNRDSEEWVQGVASLLHRIPADSLTGFATARGEEALTALARFHAAHLPFALSFWNAYRASADPERYLQETSNAVEAYRRGRPLSTLDEQELHLAYAGLDSPEGLTFEGFSREVQGEAPLPPFLTQGFQAPVRLARSLHHRVDKGKLRQALQPIEEVREVRTFPTFLSRLIQRENGSLKRIRPDLEAAFPSGVEGLGKAETLAGVRVLLSRLRERPASPPVQNLITHLALLLAWHRDGFGNLRERMSVARGERIASEVVWEGLQATEEFYRDTVEDVLREAGMSGDQVPLIRKQRRLLAAELERAREESEETREVEFLPSRNHADRFFGYVGEDCTKDMGESILREDFQVYRMISGGRLTGMLYLYEARLDGQRVLVMAIQPRSFWEVEHRDLLRTIEENFSRIAHEEGYDAVLLMNDGGQQSNRQDMLRAIAERDYPPRTFRQDISGAVFSGKGFLVMWERGVRKTGI